MVEKEILPDVKNIKTQETYTLPSKGLVYTNTDGIPSAITLRRMTTREDKIRLRNQSEDRIRRDLLQACIVENIDAGKLKLMDANFLLFRLRSLSLLNDEYKIGVKCRECGTEFVHQVNLSEIPIEYLNEEQLELLNIKLPISGDNIKLNFPNISNIITMSDDLRAYFDRFPDLDKGEYIYTSGMAVYIESVNGHHLMFEELGTYLDNMDIIDNRELSDAISKLDSVFGFTDELYAKCPKCHEEVKHGLPITAELFTPSK